MPSDQTTFFLSIAYLCLPVGLRRIDAKRSIIGNQRHSTLSNFDSYAFFSRRELSELVDIRATGLGQLDQHAPLAGVQFPIAGNNAQGLGADVAGAGYGLGLSR